jgi:hypothetical protein
MQHAAADVVWLAAQTLPANAALASAARQLAGGILGELQLQTCTGRCNSAALRTSLHAALSRRCLQCCWCIGTHNVFTYACTYACYMGNLSHYNNVVMLSKRDTPAGREGLNATHTAINKTHHQQNPPELTMYMMPYASLDGLCEP